MSPFDIINNITSSKDNIWADIEEKDYNAFMVNRGLSYHFDCVLFANEVNLRRNMPKKQQYEFLLHSIQPKKKRFSKWASSKKDQEILKVSEYYSVSFRKAAAIRNLLTDEEYSELESKLYKGGVQKK